MAENREIFIESDLVSFEGELQTLYVDTEWNVRIGREQELVAIEPEAALCLSAIMTLGDKLLGVSDREEAIAALHEQSTARGMVPTKIMTKKSLELENPEIDPLIRKSSEHTLLRSMLPIHQYLFSVGYIGAKRLMLCRNVVSMDYGLQKIQDFFLAKGDDVGLRHYEKDFTGQYRIRKQNQQQAKKAEVSFDDAIKKSKETYVIKQTHEIPKTDIVDPLKMRRARNNDDNAGFDTDTAASLERVGEIDELDIIAELLSKYTPLQEYKSVLKDFITELPVDSILQESDLLELASSLGHTPNPADIDRVILECKGLIKKTFIGGSGRVDIVAFKRFSTS